MEKFKEKLYIFMNGRYGIDQLYYGLMVLYFVLIIANSFIKSSVISAFTWVVLIVLIFRVYSRNIYKRRLENARFLKFWTPVKAKFSLSFRKIREIKTHRYRTCFNCKTVIRLPRKKGKHMVKCPRCNNRFEVHIIF
ncbi:MAG: hypothetical protein AB7V48_11185 [Sedimentibacter sp.]